MFSFGNFMRTIFIVATIKYYSTFGHLQYDGNQGIGVTEYMTTISEMSTELSSNRNVTQMDDKLLPQDCSQREKLKNQPTNDFNSRFKKCCPIGESLNLLAEQQNENLCHSTELQFHPNIINAVLYDNCIEDTETDISLPLEIGNPCNTSFLYDNNEDIFYVLQDGSLLIMDEYGNDTYTVENEYCLDIDNVSKTTYAIICITSVELHLKRSQIVTLAIMMLVSIPCLILVSYLHIFIKELRTVHGLTLSLMSLCLGIGYFMYSLVHIFKLDSPTFGYIIQFFILSYFFWYLSLCCNVLLNVWYKVPLNKESTKLFGGIMFTIYCFLSFCISLILVILTIKKGLPGMPSYFIKGVTESIRESQRYFIPPVSCTLFLSFLIMVISFFGFQRINKWKLLATWNKSDSLLSTRPNIDEQRYEAIKKDAKCISLMGIILITSWMLEIVTFYSPGPEGYFILMEIINGLQGVLILLIFLVVRRRRTIILRWWYDRGSHNVDTMELSAMNN